MLQPLGDLKRTHFLFFGECRAVAQKKTLLPGASFESLGPALERVFLEARKDDTVLLSPGGTSLDEFRGFEDRGHYFVEAIRKFYSSKS